MASIQFTDLLTVVPSSWLNPVDTATYDNLGTPGGTPNALTAVGPASLADLTTGQDWYILPAASNTGPVTLAISSSGNPVVAFPAIPVIKFGTIPLTAGDLVANSIARLYYDGANFQLLNPGTTVLPAVLPILRGGTGQTTAPLALTALNGADRSDLANTIDQTKGAALVGFLQAGTGAVGRTLQRKVMEEVAVTDFGADITGGADSYAAYQNAIAALPTAGGTISVGPGTYLLSAAPNTGSKSIYWNISPDAIFTGSGTGVGKFPYMSTNTAQMAVGPWIQSRSTQPGGSASNGGIAAFSVEMLQPAAANVAQSVSLYSGATGSSTSATANVWAANFLVSAKAGAAGIYQGIEVDVDNSSASSTTYGIQITGQGTNNPGRAVAIAYSGAQKWAYGLDISNCAVGFSINTDSVSNPIKVGHPAFSSYAPGTAAALQQISNGADTIFLERFSDVTPSGYFIRAVNAANNANIVIWDTLGNLTTTSLAAPDGVTVVNGTYSFSNMFATVSNPGISSGFGTGASVGNANGSLTFRVNVGTGGVASSGVISMPLAVNGWNAVVQVLAPNSSQLLQTTAITGTTNNTISLSNYTTATGALVAWPSGTILMVNAVAY